MAPRSSLQILLLFAGFLLSSDMASAQGDTDVFVARLASDASGIRIGDPTNISNRPGYDNQPQFLLDDSGVIFTSIRDGQADVYLWDFTSRPPAPLTATPESEYSPTPMRDGQSFSVVRVEADSVQRLWRFGLSGGTPRLLLPDVEPVGYHAWGYTDIVGLFVLGEPPTFVVANVVTGEARAVAGGIGRCIQKIPMQRAMSFVQKTDSTWMIQRYDVGSGETSPVVETLSGIEDHAWMSDGATVLMARGTTIYAWEPAGRIWQPVRDFSDLGVTTITRIAVNPSGTRIAFVAE